MQLSTDHTYTKDIHQIFRFCIEYPLPASLLATKFSLLTSQFVCACTIDKFEFSLHFHYCSCNYFVCLINIFPGLNRENYFFHIFHNNATKFIIFVVELFLLSLALTAHSYRFLYTFPNLCVYAKCVVYTLGLLSVLLQYNLYQLPHRRYSALLLVTYPSGCVLMVLSRGSVLFYRNQLTNTSTSDNTS